MIARMTDCGQGWMSQPFVDFRRKQPLHATGFSLLLFRIDSDWRATRDVQLSKMRELAERRGWLLIGDT
jgi:hypothetical protein